MTAAGLTVHLLAAKIRIARHAWLDDRPSRLRLAAIVVAGAVFVIAVFFAATWFFARCLAVEPIGEVVVRRILAMTLMVVSTLLAFSALVDAFQTFYLAEDLTLLVPRPLPTEALFAARLTETAVHASWMLLPGVLPVFLAAGRLFSAGPGYYLAVATVLPALAVLASNAGVTVSLVLTRFLPARRARLVLVVTGSVAAALVILLLRGLQPERFMNPEMRAPLLEALGALQGSDAPWLPSTWATAALWPHLGATGTTAGHPLLLLVLTAISSFFITGWIFRLLYPDAFSRALEGGETSRSAGDLPAVHGRSLERLRTRSGRGGGRRRFTAELAAKDRRVFVRDAAQWSQLLLLAAIGGLYVLNFRYIRAVTGTGLIPDIGLHFLNLGLTGFVIIALATRFGFPAVSLEGPAFWMIRAAPVPASRFLVAKARSLEWAMVIFANALMIVTHLSLGAAPSLVAASVVTVTPLTLGVIHLSLGLGARFPDFRSDNPAAIATGIGGLLFMLSAAALLVIVVVLSALPTVLVVRALAGRMPPSDWWWVAAVVAGGAAVGLPFAAGRLARRFGARHLEALERI